MNAPSQPEAVPPTSPPQRARKGGRWFTPRDIANVQRWYVEDGESIRTIAAKMGRSYNAVHYHLEQAGVAFRPPGGDNRSGLKLTAAERPKIRAKAVKLRQEGHTIAAVAAAIGCSHHVTHALLNEAARPDLRPARPAERPKRRAEAKARYLAGQSLTAVAAALAVSRSTVQRLLDEAGVTPRPWGAAALKDPSQRQALRLDAATRYQAGAPLREIAQAGGYSPATARTLLTEAGIAVQRRSPHRGEQRQRGQHA